MNATVMQLTARTLLGKRRIWLLLAIPLVLLVLSVIVRLTAGQDDATALGVAAGFGLGTLVPLIALLAGTGVVGPEIDDGSIVYLLSKPISRFTIVLSKLVVSIATALALGAVPVAISAYLLAQTPGEVVPALTVAAAAAVAVYCTLFLLLAVVTRNAVIVGLLYAIVWETTIAAIVPGAQALSVRQWSLALAEKMLGAADAARLGVDAAVGLGTGVVALVVLAVASTVYAGMRLRTIHLATAAE